MALADTEQTTEAKPGATLAELHREIRVLRHRVERLERQAPAGNKCVFPDR